MDSTYQGSEKKYTMLATRDVMVPMRDGVHVAADIFRPDSDEKFPALLAMSPYGKGIQSMTLARQPKHSPIHLMTIEAGDPEYLASRGYVHVIADMRGSGQSEGEYLGWMSKQEAEDGYDMVEWIAAQPWCDGNVGMVGISYYGDLQLIVAAQQPPHLKAIMPWNAPADFYREATHHGGMLQMFYYFLYVQKICAENSASVTLKSLPKEEVKRLVARLKADPDIQINPEIYTFVDNPRKAPCFFDILANPLDGPYYWERSPYTMYDRIKIPFYTRSGWWAYAHMHLVGAFRNYNGIDAPKKLEIDAPTVEPRPLPDEYNAEVLRWYDYWLKGMNTGVMDEPPIRFFVNGAGAWRHENEWPLARTVWTKFYLRRWEELSTELEVVMGKPDAFVQQPPDETGKISSIQYLSHQLERDLEITGPAAIYFHASIDQDDTNWIVSLRDVAPTGRQVELTKGFLKASHRALDAKLSESHTPYHPHVNPEPVTPGRIYQYAIALAPLSNVFKAGHRIKLVISCMDHARVRDFERDVDLAPSATHAPWHLCSSKTTLHKVFHDAEHPSHLLLPVIPAS